MYSHKEVIEGTALLASEESCRITSLQGTWHGTADCFLQVHDARTAPDNGAVPVWETRLFGAAPFVYADLDLQLDNGCYICFSTSANPGQKTLVTAVGDNGNIFVDGVGFETARAITVVGNLTSGVDSLEVWTTGTNRLLRIDLISASDSDAYMMLFSASADNGETPLHTEKIVAGTTREFSFGREGLDLRRTVSGTAEDDCYIYMSSTEAKDGLTKTTDIEFFIRAAYVTP